MDKNKQLFELATTVWYKFVPDSFGGHPGLVGPSGADTAGDWNLADAYLDSAIYTLTDLLKKHGLVTTRN